MRDMVPEIGAGRGALHLKSEVARAKKKPRGVSGGANFSFFQKR
jgi:hypothetical protein